MNATQAPTQSLSAAPRPAAKFAAAAGWYPEPGGFGGERYWDGLRWTARRRRITRERAGPPQATAAIDVRASVLTTEDGASYPLDRAYVIGRAPTGDATGGDQNASPIVVHNDPFVSRIHAYVWIRRGTVFVRDASTPGGSFITPPGAKSWTRIGTTPTELPPEHSLLVGSRIFTHQIGLRP